MTDENNQVSGDAGESGELPTPNFSSEATSSPSDADVIVSKLTPILEQIVERKVQSVKDKRFSEIEKALGGRSKLLAELESEGVAIPKEVRSELRMRELEERLTQPTQQPVSDKVDGSTNQRQAVTEAVSELNKYGLDSNDADFISLLRGQYKNRAEFDLAVSRHVVKKLAPPPPASPAGLTQGAAVTGGVTKNVDTLTKEYQSEMRATPRGPGGDAQRKALKAKYFKEGVPVYEIDFT